MITGVQGCHRRSISGLCLWPVRWKTFLFSSKFQISQLYRLKDHLTPPVPYFLPSYLALKRGSSPKNAVQCSLVYADLQHVPIHGNLNLNEVQLGCSEGEDIKLGSDPVAQEIRSAVARVGWRDEGNMAVKPSSENDIGIFGTSTGDVSFLA